MAISWILKQRIRINPNIIYKLRADEITDEVVRFALSQSRFSYNSFDEYAFVGENEVFARAFFETEQANPSHRIKYLLNKFEKYTEGFKSEIIKSVIERENSFLSFDSFSKEVLSENPELYIKLLRESDGVLPYTDIKFTAFSQEQIDIIHEIKKDKEFFKHFVNP